MKSAKTLKKANKQEIAYRYIKENLLDGCRLRHDLLSDQVQIMATDGGWRDLTTTDINSLVCDCSLETGVAVSAKEI